MQCAFVCASRGFEEERATRTTCESIGGKPPVACIIAGRIVLHIENYDMMGLPPKRLTAVYTLRLKRKPSSIPTSPVPARAIGPTHHALFIHSTMNPTDDKKVMMLQ